LLITQISLSLSNSLLKKNIRNIKNNKSQSNSQINFIELNNNNNNNNNINNKILLEIKIKNKNQENYNTNFIPNFNLNLLEVKQIKTNNANPNPNYINNDYNNHNKTDFSKAININCTQNNCRFPNYCSKDRDVCLCANTHAELIYNNKRSKIIEESINSKYNNKNIKEFCLYKRKNQIIYFLLELIFNCGIGHIYAGNLINGIIKMVLVIMPCLIFMAMILMGIMSSSKIADMSVIGYCINLTLICALLAWWIVDIVLIATGFYVDGNGVPLINWDLNQINN
jgi:hypothetical protein